MRNHSLLLATMVACTACVVDDDLSTSQQQLTSIDHEPPPTEDDPVPDPVPPRDPRQPRVAGLSTARIDMDLLSSLVSLRLTGTKISIDATGNAPGMHRPGETYRQCTRDSEGYDDARELCLTIPTGRLACLRAAAAEYPQTCVNVPIYHHSYLAFPAALHTEYPTLTDYLTDVDTFRVGTWFGDIDVTLNQIATTLDSGNTFAYATMNELGARIALNIKAGSGQPTAYCRHTSPYRFCPDIELTNMSFTLLLQLRPSIADSTRIGFGSIDTVFGFDRNINNFPDWLVDAFFDLDARIRVRTEGKVRDALADPGRHEAVELAVDEIITLVAQASVPGFGGFGEIDEITYFEGDLYVHYTQP